jgi:Anti-sigma-K factor rskA, C-terminal/Putative zinc-finger
VTAGHPQDDLPGLLLGELPPGTATAVDRHLAGCDPCRRDLAAVAVAASALRDAARLPVAEVRDLPRLGIPAAVPIHRGGSKRPPEPPLLRSVGGDRRRRRRWLAVVAAVLVALALGVGGLEVGRDRGAGRGQTVALGAPAGGGATAEAHMRGAGDDQVMTISARGLPRPPAGGYYEVWLVGDGGGGFPVGVLAPDGEGIWSLPAEVAARYLAITVTLEPADGDPAMSTRTVLHGAYA